MNIELEMLEAYRGMITEQTDFYNNLTIAMEAALNSVSVTEKSLSFGYYNSEQLMNGEHIPAAIAQYRMALIQAMNFTDEYEDMLNKIERIKNHLRISKDYIQEQISSIEAKNK